MESIVFIIVVFGMGYSIAKIYKLFYTVENIDNEPETDWACPKCQLINNLKGSTVCFCGYDKSIVKQTTSSGPIISLNSEQPAVLQPPKQYSGAIGTPSHLFHPQASDVTSAKANNQTKSEISQQVSTPIIPTPTFKSTFKLQALALTVCFGILVLYIFIVNGFLGSDHGGGIIPRIILGAILIWVWRIIINRNK